MGIEPLVVGCLTGFLLASGTPRAAIQDQETPTHGGRDLFGAVLEGLDDLDHDGVGELLVTAPLSYDGRGSVWILSPATGLPLVRVVGTVDGGSLGVTACGLGDVDGDGKRDFAAGWQGPGGSLGGVRVCSGADGRVLLAVDGQTLGLRLGGGLAPMDDLDGDGHADLAVLAQDVPRTREDSRLDCTSVARLLVLSGADGHELARVEDPARVRRETTGIACVGDVDADGLVDLALSGAREPLESSEFGSEPAFVDVLSGRNLRRLLHLSGGCSQADFGWRVARAGDVDADGRGDVLVAFPKLSSGAYDFLPPSVTVCSGADGHELLQVLGDGWGFAHALSSAGDVDGDGHGDVLHVDEAGGVCLRSGRDGQLLEYWRGGSCRGGLTSTSDLDQDGAPDFAVCVASSAKPDAPHRVCICSSRSGELLRELNLAGAEAAWREREAKSDSQKGR